MKKKKKVINVLTAFFISHKNNVKIFIKWILNQCCMTLVNISHLIETGVNPLFYSPLHPSIMTCRHYLFTTFNNLKNKTDHTQLFILLTTKNPLINKKSHPPFLGIEE